MQNTPYRLKKNHLACENRYFSVYLDTIEKGEALEVQDYLTVIPKSKDEDEHFAVSIMPIQNGEIGLLRLYRHPNKKYGWEIPGGFIEPKETAQDAALRELKEESGFSCKIENLQDLGSVAPAPSLIGGRIHTFIAKDCFPIQNDRVLEFGHQEFKWFSKQEVETLIQKKEISEAITLLVYYRIRNSI